MNERQIFLCLSLILFGADGCNDEPQLQSRSLQVEERAMLKFADLKEGAPDLIGNVGGIVDIININYSAPPKEVIKAVGDAIVPMISAGLSLIPGGALIGGLFETAWGFFSGLFGGPAPKSPMQLMIEDMQEEINNIKNDVAALKASLNITIQKHLDENLSKIINRAIHGELRRNEYICNKYAILSGDFSHDLKHKLPINENIRTEMIAQIHDCDNFLKDTVEAFVYPEYADVLWIPNVITTLVRVGFLTEISNYGAVFGMNPKILSLFWSEMKVDIKKAFEFYSFGVIKKAKIIDAFKTTEELNKWGNFTIAEYEGCVMQAQLLYLDREMYPFGVPQYFRIFDDDSELKIDDYNTSGSDEPRHIQIYYNEVFRRNSHNDYFESLLNCFSGPDRVTRVPHYKLSFRVQYIANKTYEMRILYFAEESSKRTVIVDKKGGNNYLIHVDDGEPSKESVHRFVFNTAFHHLLSTPPMLFSYLKETSVEQYSYSPTISEGAYVVETVLFFTIKPNDEVTGKIEINVDGAEFVYLFGVEFIVRPLVKEL